MHSSSAASNVGATRNLCNETRAQCFDWGASSDWLCGANSCRARRKVRVAIEAENWRRQKTGCKLESRAATARQRRASAACATVNCARNVKPRCVARAANRVWLETASKKRPRRAQEAALFKASQWVALCLNRQQTNAHKTETNSHWAKTAQTSMKFRDATSVEGMQRQPAKQESDSSSKSDHEKKQRLRFAFWSLQATFVDLTLAWVNNARIDRWNCVLLVLQLRNLNQFELSARKLCSRAKSEQQTSPVYLSTQTRGWTG